MHWFVIGTKVFGSFALCLCGILESDSGINKWLEWIDFVLHICLILVFEQLGLSLALVCIRYLAVFGFSFGDMFVGVCIVVIRCNFKFYAV